MHHDRLTNVLQPATACIPLASAHLGASWGTLCDQGPNNGSCNFNRPVCSYQFGHRDVDRNTEFTSSSTHRLGSRARQTAGACMSFQSRPQLHVHQELCLSSRSTSDAKDQSASLAHGRSRRLRNTMPVAYQTPPMLSAVAGHEAIRLHVTSDCGISVAPWW